MPFISTPLPVPLGESHIQGRYWMMENSGGYTFPPNPDYLGGIGTTAGSASQSGGIADFALIGFTIGAGFMW
jgi:hypothetical protein